jgi:dUTP pyrophosphatase
MITDMNFLSYDYVKNILTPKKQPIRNCAILKLVIKDESLKTEYITKINNHNAALNNNQFVDSGFDLLVPEKTIFTKEIDSKFIDMGVKAEMLYFDSNISMVSNCAFNIHPRSSISKTPLMLANHTGIIDAGYRGSLIGAFRWLKSNTSTQTEYVVDKYTRLLQVCHPTLCPIFVIIVNEDELTTTERGDSGFGSTGV